LITRLAVLLAQKEEVKDLMKDSEDLMDDNQDLIRLTLLKRAPTAQVGQTGKLSSSSSSSSEDLKRTLMTF